MKKIITSLFTVAIIALGSVSSFAQTTDAEVDLMQAVFHIEKQSMMKESMALSAEHKDAFWTTFNAYEAERKELAKKRIALLQKYAEKYETLTEEDAASLMAESFKYQSEELKLRKSYFSKFQKATSAKVAARWMQIENYINTAITFAILDGLPFIGDYE